MNNWSPGSVVFWFALAIFVPALLVHFTLGRKGGHHLFDKDGLTPEETRKLPLDILHRRIGRQVQGSKAVLAGLLVVVVLYPLGCRLGLPINVFGIPEQKLNIYIIGLVVLGLTLGPALYRKWHER
jgi:hypothetical protein